MPLDEIEDDDVDDDVDDEENEDVVLAGAAVIEDDDEEDEDDEEVFTILSICLFSFLLFLAADLPSHVFSLFPKKESFLQI